MQQILNQLSEDVEEMSSDAMLSVKVDHLERMLNYIHELEESKRNTVEYINELRAEGVVL